MHQKGQNLGPLAGVEPVGPPRAQGQQAARRGRAEVFTARTGGVLCRLRAEVLAAHASGPAPQFAFFGAVVTALTVLLVWQLPETNGIDFD